MEFWIIDGTYDILKESTEEFRNLHLWPIIMVNNEEDLCKQNMQHACKPRHE